MLWQFFLSCLVVGSLTFGGGYAMISALQQDLVAHRGWLTPTEFANGVAVGQVTPGPLMILVAFLGYKLAGVWGALLGTAGLFGPSFVIAVLLSRHLGAVKENQLVKGALHGVEAGVAGLLFAAALSLTQSSLTGPIPIILALGAAAATGLSKGGHVWVLVAAGLAGAFLLR